MMISSSVDDGDRSKVKYQSMAILFRTLSEVHHSFSNWGPCPPRVHMHGGLWEI